MTGIFRTPNFWHGCPIHATQPKSNAEFWQTNGVRQHGDGLAGRRGPVALVTGDRLRVPRGRNRSQIARNQARDLLVTRTLRRAGWGVFRLWEHELARKNEKRLLARFRRYDLIS